MWIPLLALAAGYGLYKAFSPSLLPLDASLTKFQKLELSNALEFIDNPQILEVMRVQLISDSPPKVLAAEALRRKIAHLQNGGTNANFQRLQYNFS